MLPRPEEEVFVGAVSNDLARKGWWCTVVSGPAGMFMQVTHLRVCRAIGPKKFGTVTEFGCWLLSVGEGAISYLGD